MVCKRQESLVLGDCDFSHEYRVILLSLLRGYSSKSKKNSEKKKGTKKEGREIRRVIPSTMVSLRPTLKPFSIHLESSSLPV